MSDFLNGKVAVVTGGSGTIGKAIAKGLLISGCNVFITGRNQQRLEEAIAEITSDDANHGEVKIFQGDVCNDKDVSNLFDAVIEAFGRVDLLVNNAGTGAKDKTVDLETAEFDRVMRVNVTGPFICAREAMKRMIPAKNGGRIINIGSISAISPRPNSAPYTASKFALLGLSHSLSLDCREHGIGVGVIHPGNVISGILDAEEIKRRSASEGFMNAEDVANCVLAMSSLPYHSNVLEMTVTPTMQPLIGRG